MFNNVAESQSSKAKREGKNTEENISRPRGLYGDRKSLKATDRLVGNLDLPPDLSSLKTLFSRH